VARHFSLSDNFAIKLLQRQRQSGSPAPAPQVQVVWGKQLSPYRAFLIQAVKTKPGITMPELTAWLLGKHEMIATPAALSRLLCRHGLSLTRQEIEGRREFPVGRLWNVIIPGSHDADLILSGFRFGGLPHLFEESHEDTHSEHQSTASKRHPE